MTIIKLLSVHPYRVWTSECLIGFKKGGFWSSLEPGHRRFAESHLQAPLDGEPSCGAESVCRRQAGKAVRRPLSPTAF